ncbi:MAG: reverse transcriptase family protein [Terracidiphilus sp.]|nr:reverse transcriptase family protein [Terracidiphilus sp.]
MRRSVDQRDSADGATFIERMDAVGLIVLNGLVDAGSGLPAAATRGSDSVIDFIMVSVEHWTRMSSVTVDMTAAAEVASDHLLIHSTLELPLQPQPALPGSTGGAAATLPNKVAAFVSRTRFLAHSCGDASYFADYQRECSERFSAIVQRWETAVATEKQPPIEQDWTEFHSTIEEAARVTIGIKDTSAASAKPRKGPRREVHRAGDAALREWKRQRRKLLEKQKSTAAAADPSASAALATQLRSLSMHIKKHVRKAVREQRQQEVDKVRSLAPTQWREHWRALRRLGNLSTGGAQGAASTVLDADGVEHSSPDKIREVWLEFWAKLAREAPPDDPRFDAAAMQQMEQQLEHEERIEQEDRLPGPPQAAEQDAEATLNCPITLAEVAASIQRLLNGKAPGCDAVLSEILKNGGEQVERALHALCVRAFTSAPGQPSPVPLDWMRGEVVPIWKEGDKRLPSNYRPITLLSIVAKVYTGVLQARLLAWTERNGIIVEEQGGFRPGRGCPEQLYTLTELVKLRRLRGWRTFACFLDIKKAYDTVWHKGLRLRLLQSGVRGAMYRAICSLYAACESCLRLGGEAGYTDFFLIEAGVRQGCILSPLLYSIFINGLALELKASGLGALIDRDGKHKLCVLLYADDIVLLGETAAELQALLHIVGAYARRWRFLFNHTKSGGMRFNRSGAGLPTSAIMLDGTPIPWVRCYRYLGVELSNTPGHPYRAFRCRMLASANSAAGQISAMGLYSGKLSVPLGVQVYQALVQPLLEYAAEITSLLPWTAAERIHARTAKRILQSPSCASTVGTLGELGWITLEGRWQLLRLNLWSRIQCMSVDRPARQVYEASLRDLHLAAEWSEGVPAVPAEAGWPNQRPTAHSHASQHLWCTQLHRDLCCLGLSTYWEQPDRVKAILPVAWKNRCHKAVYAREAAMWWAKVQARPHLLQFHAGLAAAAPPPRLVRQPYLNVAQRGWNDPMRRGRCAITALRTFGHRLRIRTGEWEEHLPRALRTCRLCGVAGALEDEPHFLLHCAFFDETRKALYSRINQLVREAESTAPVAGQPPRMFDLRAEPLPLQLSTLAAGSHPRIAKARLQRAVHELILLQVAIWSREHEAHLARLRQICSPR